MVKSKTCEFCGLQHRGPPRGPACASAMDRKAAEDGGVTRRAEARPACPKCGAAVARAGDKCPTCRQAN